MTSRFQADFDIIYTSLMQAKLVPPGWSFRRCLTHQTAAFRHKGEDGVNKAVRGLMKAHQETNSTRSEQRNGETLAGMVVFGDRHKLDIIERDLISI